jgi:transposase
MNTITEIAHLRDRLIELLGAANERAHEQVERSNQTIKQWIESFEMTLTDKGWSWKDDLIECYNDLLNKYNELVKNWNRYIASFEARQAVGRPLRASKAQQAQVRKLRKIGHTLREIANETNLSFQTIRTIIGQKGGVVRTDRKKNKLRKIDLNYRSMNSWRARKRTGDAQINAVLKDSKNLLKDGDNLLKDGRELLKK